MELKGASRSVLGTRPAIFGPEPSSVPAFSRAPVKKNAQAVMSMSCCDQKRLRENPVFKEVMTRYPDCPALPDLPAFSKNWAESDFEFFVASIGTIIPMCSLKRLGGRLWGHFLCLPLLGSRGSYIHQYS